MTASPEDALELPGAAVTLPRGADTLSRELSTLRSALDAHAIVSVTDARGIIVDANERFCAISGYEREELIGNSHRILKSGAHPPEFYRELWRTISSGEAWHGVIENRGKHGQSYWVQSSILPLRDAGGRITGYLSLRTDVSAIERQRHALRLMSAGERHGHYQAIAEALAFARAARAAAVLARDEKTGHLRLRGAWHADDGMFTADFLPSRSIAGRVGRQPLRVELANTTDWASDPLHAAARATLELTPLLDEDGSQLGLLLVGDAAVDDAATYDTPFGDHAARHAANLLQRERTRRNREEQRAWLEFVIDGAKAGVWDWDLENDHVRFNARWAEMLGYQAGELSPRLDSWERLVHPDDRAAVWRSIEAHIAGRTSYYESEHRLLSAFDSWVWVLDRGMISARDDDGRPLRMSGIHLDITSQRQVQQALAAEQERLDLVLRTSPLGLWEWDLDSDDMQSSPQWLERLGYTGDSRPTTGSAWRALIHPEDLSRVVANKEAHLADPDKPYVVDFRVLNAAGEWRWVLSRASVTARDRDGHAQRLTGVHIDIHEQRQAEATLRAQQSHLEHIVAAAGLGLWEWDVQSGRFTANNGLENLLGYPRGHFRHVDDWIAILHPDEHETILSAVEEHHAGRTAYIQMEARARHADGDWRWMIGRSYVAERDADGLPLRMVGLQIDIHARKVAEEQLAASKARLELVLRSANIGLYEWNIDSGAHHVDERWADMLGYRVDELSPDIDTWRKLLHPADLASVEQELEQLLRGDFDSYSHETRLRTKDGNWAWVLDRGTIMARDEHGRALLGAGIHIDITERKRAEAALAESEARLRALIENSPVGVCMADLDGRITYANPVVRAMLGHTVQGTFNRAWSGAIHADDSDAALSSWDRYVAEDETAFDHEYRIVRTDGDIRTVHVRAAPVRSDGVILGHVGIFEDMTVQRELEGEHERMRRQVQQAQKMEAIGQLTGGIAHDFNNILGGVLGFSSLALRRFGDQGDDKLAEYLQAIVAAGERGRDLVGKMLAFSRSSPADNIEPVDPRAVVSEAATMLGALIPASIAFEVDLGDNLPSVQVDGVELHQVLVNLVVNARDAVGENGRIDVRLFETRVADTECTACHQRVSGRYVELDVADDGAGIDAAARERLFEPFYSTKEVGKGTGMGLAVVHGVLQRCRGHVLVESQAGAGAVFRVLLPIADAEVSESHREYPPESAAAIAGLRILLVDDDALMRGYLGEVLAGAGARVTTARDGRQAYAMFEAAPQDFDALVTDLTMPGYNGDSLIERVRNIRPHLPVVLLSGNAERGETEPMRRSRVPLLGKPVDETLLLRTLAGLTARLPSRDDTGAPP